MKKEKIEVVYQMVIRDLVLNKYNLKSKGFSNNDISTLVDMSVIKLIGVDMYQLVSVRDLYNYGIKLVEAKQGIEADMCFAKCYEMAPNDREIWLQYLLSFVRKSDYKKALEVYDKLVPGETYDSCKDDNLILYFLGVLTELDLEHAVRVKGLTCNDVLLENTSCNRLDNEMRKNIMQSKYPYACSIMNEKMKKLGKYSVRDELIKSLLIRTLDAERKFKSKLLISAKDEKYNTIVMMLKNREKQRNLNRIEECILLLSETIINAIESNVLESYEVSNIGRIHNMYDAILVKDFKLAMDMNLEFLEYNKENGENDIVHILLVKVNELTEEIKVKNDDNNGTFEIELESIIEENSLGETYMESLISDTEEWAYYIKSFDMDIKKGIRKVGLVPKYANMVKLIFARDYYLEGEYSLGDVLLSQVESSSAMDRDVLLLLDEVRFIRNNNGKGYTKKLVK